MARKALTVSIVIPVYNEEDYLPACLKSIRAQTVAPAQVIVVDNNSTDHTARVARQHSFVTLLAERQQGRYFAQKTGFAAATSDIIARLDGDTHLPTDWVEQISNYFAAHPNTAAVSGPGVFYDFPFKSVVGFLHQLIYFRLQSSVARTAILWGSNMAIRRQVLDKVSLRVGEHVHEDIDLTLKLKRAGLRIGYLPAVRAQMSMRHGKLGPIQTAKYLWGAPRDYFYNRYYASGLVYGFCLLLVYVLLLPVMILHSVWTWIAAYL